MGKCKGKKLLCSILALVLLVMSVNIPTKLNQVKASVLQFADATAIQFGKTYSGTMLSSTEYNYKFTVPKSGKVEFLFKTTASDQTQEALFTLYDPNGEKINSYYAIGNGQNSAVYYLNAGEYYINGLGYSSFGHDYGVNVPYTITVGYTSSKESFAESDTKNDDSASNANKIYLGKKYRGQYALNDSYDYYLFTVPMDGKVTLSYSSDKQYAAYKFLNKSGKEIAQGWIEPGEGSITKTVELKAGTYYFVGDYGMLTGENTDIDDWGFYNFTLNYKPTVAVKITKATRKGTNLSLSWKKVKGAEYYEVSYSTDKNFKKSKTKTIKVKSTSTKIKKLNKKNTYYVRVCACAKNGKKVYYSKYSKVKTLKK
jgi:hypothetical protein